MQTDHRSHTGRRGDTAMKLRPFRWDEFICSMVIVIVLYALHLNCGTL
jgi:hypothetical protein